MMERDRQQLRMAYSLKIGELVYFTMDSANEDIVGLVVGVGFSEDVMLVSLAPRGPDSSTYWNNPDRIRITMARAAVIRVVRPEL